MILGDSGVEEFEESWGVGEVEEGRRRRGEEACYLLLVHHEKVE